MSAAARARAALRANLALQQAPPYRPAARALTCRVWPKHSDFAMEDREWKRGKSDVIPAVGRLWAYIAAEDGTAERTPGRYSDLAAVIRGIPNGLGWAVLPAIVGAWPSFRSFSNERCYPPLAKEPELASVAKGSPFEWWSALDNVRRYQPALQAGLRPGGPTTCLHSEGGIGGAGELFDLERAIDRRPRKSPLGQFIRFLDYHEGDWEVASSEWQRAGNQLPSGIGSAEHVSWAREALSNSANSGNPS